MTDTTYNGWRNYETWRINLELCDDIIEGLRGDIPLYTEPFADVYALRDYLEETCKDYVRGEDYDESNLATQYAMAFLSDVCWYEIAENHATDDPWLLASDDDSESDDDE